MDEAPFRIRRENRSYVLEIFHHGEWHHLAKFKKRYEAEASLELRQRALIERKNR